MYTKSKRILCALLCGALLCGLSAGCSSAPEAGSGGAGTSQAPSAQSGGEDAPNPGTKYKISWTGYQMAPLGNDPVILRHFEEELGVEFDIWNIDHQQYAELLNVRLASGEIPDIFMIRDPSDLTKYVAQEVLAPIPMESIEKYMPNTLQYSYGQVNPGALDLGKVNGEIYGLPAMSMSNQYRLPIVYNQNWLDKLGKAVPRTIDEFEDVIYAFANDDPDGNGVKDTYGLSKEGLNLLWGMYNMVPRQDYFYEKDGTLVYMPCEPEMKEALAYANKWYKDGVLDPEFITGENTGGYWAVSHSYINQRIGMTVIGNYYHWNFGGDYNDYVDGAEVPCEPGSVAKELLALHPDAKLSFGEPLANKDGVQGGVRAYNLLMRFYAIGADAAEDPGKFNKILEIMEYTSDSQPDLDTKLSLRNGFENEHWVWAEQERETVRALSPILEDENVKYELGAILWWASGQPNKDRRSEWAAGNGFDRGGIYSAMPIATDAMSKYKAQLETLREQAYIQIITGEKPLDYFDTFVQEYNAQGGQEILDQANAWYAAK